MRFNIEDVADWKRYLDKQGYVVLKSVASAGEVEEAKNLLWEELQRRRPGLVRADPATWKHLPKPNFGLCGALAQSQGQWYLRDLPKLKQVFAEFWACEDLLCSMDCVLLRARGAAASTEGLHLDQNPLVKPVCECVQGMIPLLPVTLGSGGLQVVPGSHGEAFRERLRQVHPNLEELSLDDDWCPLRSMGGLQGRLFHDELVRSATLLLAEPGDLILWDSRTVHGGRLPDLEALRAEQSQDGALARLSCTVAMTPRAFAIPQVIGAHRQGEVVSLVVPENIVADENCVLSARRAGFEVGKCFNHCPHQMESTGNVGSGNDCEYKRPIMTPSMELLIDGPRT